MPADRGSVRCLGIDPGIGRLGFGLVLQTGTSLNAVEYGCLETRPGEDLPKRLLVLFSSLGEIVDRLAPDIFAVERLFFSEGTRQPRKPSGRQGEWCSCWRLSAG